jgi:CBF1 interacting corepressor
LKKKRAKTARKMLKEQTRTRKMEASLERQLCRAERAGRKKRKIESGIKKKKLRKKKSSSAKSKRKSKGKSSRKSKRHTVSSTSFSETSPSSSSASE